MKVGIDPGLSGAIAFVDDDEIRIFDMPLIDQSWSKGKKNKKGVLIKPQMVDSVRLHQIIKACPKVIDSITIEAVHTMPNQGVASSGKFMGAFYTAIAVARLFMEPKMAHPAVWKKKFGLINMPKDASRLAVLKMYPELWPQLSRKKDCDRAEALMIAVSQEGK